MALKTLVENPSPFIKQVIAFIEGMTKQNRGFALALLVPSEASQSDRWNLVLSAPWIDHAGLAATIPTVTDVLLQHLSRGNSKKLERISVLPTTDPLVDRVAGLGPVPLGKAYRVQYFPLFSGDLGEAIVLVAERPRAMHNYNVQSVRTRA